MPHPFLFGFLRVFISPADYCVQGSNVLCRKSPNQDLSSGSFASSFCVFWILWSFVNTEHSRAYGGTDSPSRTDSLGLKQFQGIFTWGFERTVLVRSGEEIQAMGYSPKASGSLTQLRRQGAISLAGLVHFSFQQVQSSQPFPCSLDGAYQPSGSLLRQK